MKFGDKKQNKTNNPKEWQKGAAHSVMPELLFWGKTLVLRCGCPLVPVCSLVLGSNRAAEQSHRTLISPHESPQLSTSFPLLWTRLLSFLHPLFLHFLLCFSATSCHKKTKNNNKTKPWWGEEQTWDPTTWDPSGGFGDAGPCLGDAG